MLKFKTTELDKLTKQKGTFMKRDRQNKLVCMFDKTKGFL